MAAALSQAAVQLLQEPNFADIATVMPNGIPQLTPVWVDTDGTHVIFNTAMGRQKTVNMERNANIGVLVMDRNDPGGRWLSVQGRVVAITAEGGDAHIDKMAKKYTGADTYPYRKAEETRVIVTIEPVKVIEFGL